MEASINFGQERKESNEKTVNKYNRDSPELKLFVRDFKLTMNSYVRPILVVGREILWYAKSQIMIHDESPCKIFIFIFWRATLCIF